MAASTNHTKELLALAKRESKTREAHEAARAAFVSELRARRPSAAVRRELAAAAGLSDHRVAQLVYGRKGA